MSCRTRPKSGTSFRFALQNPKPLFMGVYAPHELRWVKVIPDQDREAHRKSFTPANVSDIVNGHSLSFSELLERAQAGEEYPHRCARITIAHKIASFPARSKNLRRVARFLGMDVDYTSIVQTTERGRALHAKIPFVEGDTVLRVNKPLVLVPEIAALGHTCAYCFKEVDEVKRCTQCKSSGYCSKSCQKDDWDAYHKYECAALTRAKKASGREQEPPTVIRAMIQLMLREKSPKAYVDQRWKDMEHHFTEIRQRGSDVVGEVMLQVQAVMAYGELDEKYRKWALGLFCRINCNAFRVTSPTTNRPLGLCFDPVLGLFNHSCRPNAAVEFDGRVATVKALEPIQVGDEICISYIDTTLDTKMRQAELKKTYFFKCDCKACCSEK